MNNTRLDLLKKHGLNLLDLDLRILDAMEDYASSRISELEAENKRLRELIQEAEAWLELIQEAEAWLSFNMRPDAAQITHFRKSLQKALNPQPPKEQ